MAEHVETQPDFLDRQRRRSEMDRILLKQAKANRQRPRPNGIIEGEVTEIEGGKFNIKKIRFTGHERFYQTVRVGDRFVQEEVKLQVPSEPDRASGYETLGIGRPTGEIYLPRLRRMSPRDNSETKMLTLESFLFDWYDVGYLLETEVPNPIPRRLAWINASMRLMRYHRTGLLARRRKGHRYQYTLTERGRLRLVNLWEKLGSLNPPVPEQDDDEISRLKKEMAYNRKGLALDIRAALLSGEERKSESSLQHKRKRITLDGHTYERISDGDVPEYVRID